ncbi:MAG: class I SAM-dependent methyltransferase [Halobaculum sp.]
MSGLFGRALHDHYHGDRRGPLVEHDGEQRQEHDVAHYFEPAPETDWIDARVEGPLLELGAGAGRYALDYQSAVETVALEVSERLVAVMDDRGVTDARHGDMFAVRSLFDRNRFRTVLAMGTQLCLAGPVAGLRVFLNDLAHVTTPDASLLFDTYHPDLDGSTEIVGYRPDPTPGLGYRVTAFEYDGVTSRVHLRRLFGPGRLREATVGTDWHLAAVSGRSVRYAAHLSKTPP